MICLLRALVGMAVAADAAATAIASNSDFLVVFDAGSTGTHGHLFLYEPRICYTDSLPVKVEGPLILPTEIWQALVRPGISSFVKESAGVISTLAPLLEDVKVEIRRISPATNISDVALYLGATAGMRLLDDYERDSIMGEIRSLFKSSGFRYDPQQVRILSGEEEGSFGWLSANHKMGTLSTANAFNQGTAISHGQLDLHGHLDLGGGSAQITFVPSETSILEHMFPLHFGTFAEKAIHLYSHSFLHFGYQTAFQKSAHQLSLLAFNSHSFEHPCLPQGLVWNVTSDQYGISVDGGGTLERKSGATQLRGSGDFDTCRSLARSLIGKTTKCLTTPCSMAGVYQPRLGKTKFLLAGEYPQNFHRLGIVYDSNVSEPPLRTLERKLSRWCGQSLRDQATESSEAIGTQVAKLELSCWLGVYILELLTTGFEFSIDTYDLVWGEDVSWPMGKAISEVNYLPYTVMQRQALDLFAGGQVAAWVEPESRVSTSVVVIVSAVCVVSFVLGCAANLAMTRSTRVFDELQKSLLVNPPEVATR